MSKNKHHGGKSGRDDHDDYGSGHKSKFQLLVGTNADDVLTGGSRNDLIIGLAGDDKLLGGAGNDILIGDGGTGGKHWGWNQCHWWKPKGQGDDYLDGGAGSDLVLAGKGDDFANYTLSENGRAHDVYDGGKGFDTLQLTLTHAELQLASVQKDIAAFEAFLACKANPHSDSGRTFHFQSFDLDVRNFEALKIHVVGGNTAPVAQDDAYALNEDSVLLVPGPGVATNDSDLEGSALSVAVVTGPAHGTLALGADGSFTYTPNLNFNGTDAFSYKVNDGDLDSNIATVTLQAAPMNDPPVADDEHFVMRPGQTLNVPAAQGLLNGDTDADGDPLNVSLIDVTGLQGSVNAFPDGHFDFTPAAGFSGTTSFDYTVSDGLGGIDTGLVSIDVVNSAPQADDEAYSVHAGQTLSVPAAQGLLIGDTDADGDALNVSLIDVTGLQGSVNAFPDGHFEFTPAAGFSGTTSFDYTVSDGFGGFDQASVTINVTNAAPVATDDTIGGSGGGAIRAAVVGGSTSNYVNAATWLTDSTVFEIEATPILINLSTTKAEWTAMLANYDVVVIGENGTTTFDYNGSQIFAALRDFVDAGGGVVTTGVFAKAISAYSDATTQADADYISPAAPAPDFLYVDSGSPITILNPSHDIAGDIAGYAAQGLHEIAGAFDNTATVLATDASGRTAIAYDDSMAGHTVYLGSIHMAVTQVPFDPSLTQSGPVDQIFEQAVAWAAGDQGSGATTDEDTILPIDASQLLKNDTDVEGDALSIASVAATSTLGASITIDDATGNVVYNPTVALQYLSAGEIKTDTFEYTISDGNGGFDTAKVSLTVAGMYDAPDAAIEAFSHAIAPDVDLF